MDGILIKQDCSSTSYHQPAPSFSQALLTDSSSHSPITNDLLQTVSAIPWISRVVFDIVVVSCFIASLASVVSIENTTTKTLLRFLPLALGIVFSVALFLVFECMRTGGNTCYGTCGSRCGEVYGLEKACEVEAAQLSVGRLLRHADLYAKDKFRKPNASCLAGARVGLVDFTETLRNRLRKNVSRSSFVILCVLWNAMWCVSWLISLYWWRRDAADEAWNYDIIPPIIYGLQDVMLSGATMQFCTIFLSERDLLSFMLRLSTWVDIATLPFVGVIMSQLPWGGGTSTSADTLLFLGFLRWIKTFVSVRVVIGGRQIFTSASKSQLAIVLLGIFFLISAFAAAMFTLQGVNPDIIQGSRAAYTSREVFLYFYFAVVTMSTVGYGDVYPINFGAQVCTVLFIVGCLAWIPGELSSLVDTMTDEERIFGSLPYSWTGKYPFVLLCGDVDPDHLSTLLTELYAMQRYTLVRKIVVLSDRLFGDFSAQIHASRTLGVSLCIIPGDCGAESSAGHLARINPTKAEAVYLMSRGRSQDNHTVRRLLGLRRHMSYSRFRQKVSVQLCNEETLALVRYIGCRKASYLLAPRYPLPTISSISSRKAIIVVQLLFRRCSISL
eukprot:GHVQ01027623.1.p1 GENE.GHVQ01027623.1~~GHVQ01027623.1.p1  ORF type:complete len:612 (+),score=49.48 GHVQ01027623.1:452-2287(+)